MGVLSYINGTHTDLPNSLFDCSIESPAKDGCVGAFVGCFFHALMNSLDPFLLKASNS